MIAAYNGQRLHSSIGYVTPLVKLNGEDVATMLDARGKLAAARMARKERRRVMWNWQFVSLWLTPQRPLLVEGTSSSEAFQLDHAQ